MESSRRAIPSAIPGRTLVVDFSSFEMAARKACDVHVGTATLGGMSARTAQCSGCAFPKLASGSVSREKRFKQSKHKLQAGRRNLEGWAGGNPREVRAVLHRLSLFECKSLSSGATSRERTEVEDCNAQVGAIGARKCFLTSCVSVKNVRGDHLASGTKTRLALNAACGISSMSWDRETQLPKSCRVCQRTTSAEQVRMSPGVCAGGGSSVEIA